MSSRRIIAPFSLLSATPHNAEAFTHAPASLNTSITAPCTAGSINFRLPRSLGDLSLAGRRAFSSLAAGPSHGPPTSDAEIYSDRSEGEVSVGPSVGQTDPAPRRPGEGRDMLMLFTCAKCETRCVKSMSRIAYEEGLVIATCAGCGVQHLIADHLGWFGDSGTVEDFVKGKGGLAMRRTATGDLELTPEDLIGWSRAKEQREGAATAATSQALAEGQVETEAAAEASSTDSPRPVGSGKAEGADGSPRRTD